MTKEHEIIEKIYKIVHEGLESHKYEKALNKINQLFTTNSLKEINAEVIDLMKAKSLGLGIKKIQVNNTSVQIETVTNPGCNSGYFFTYKAGDNFYKRSCVWRDDGSKKVVQVEYFDMKNNVLYDGIYQNGKEIYEKGRKPC